MDERDAYGVAEFCQRHGISRGFLYRFGAAVRARASCRPVIGGSSLARRELTGAGS